MSILRLVADDQNKADVSTQEQFDKSIVELREGAYRLSSKVRGQAALILDELIDPDGESVMCLADSEGDAGAMALAMPVDLITFETWLLGQIGDKEELDLDINTHWELWFNYGAWIGETLRRRHGGHWMIMDSDPRTWRLGFSKIMLEIAPHMFAGQLLTIGQGAVRQMLTEFERLRSMHVDQKKKDKGQELDRFTAEHYMRMHTIPLGQWFVIDFNHVGRLWNVAAARDLAKEIRKQKKRIGPENGEFIDKMLEAIGQADQSKPVADQIDDRGLFEAVAQIIAMKRTAAPLAIDVLEKYVVPAMHIGIPDRFPNLDKDDLAQLRKGIKLFELFVDIVPHKHPADDEGFLGAIPHEDLSTPYGDRANLEVGKGDWVVIDPKYFKTMLLEFDTKRMLDGYDRFVKYVRSNPKAPRRRDDGRMLAETVAAAIADLKACVVSASKEDHTLLFRMLPPPG